MKKVIENWAGKLKSGGWIALIEIDDLLRGHQPLSKKILVNLQDMKNI
mgnify:CR=1 FL=1